MARKITKQTPQEETFVNCGVTTAANGKVIKAMRNAGFQAYIEQNPMFNREGCAVRVLAIYHPNLSRCLRKIPVLYFTQEALSDLGVALLPDVVQDVTAMAQFKIDQGYDFDFANSKLFGDLR